MKHLIVILAIMTALAVGCGDGSNPPSTSSEPLQVRAWAMPVDDTDYTDAPLPVEGVVSNPAATVEVNGNQVEVLADGSFSTTVTFHSEVNHLIAIATLDGQSDSSDIAYAVDEEGHPLVIPGQGILNQEEK